MHDFINSSPPTQSTTKVAAEVPPSTSPSQNSAGAKATRLAEAEPLRANIHTPRELPTSSQTSNIGANGIPTTNTAYFAEWSDDGDYEEQYFGESSAKAAAPPTTSQARVTCSLCQRPLLPANTKNWIRLTQVNGQAKGNSNRSNFE